MALRRERVSKIWIADIQAQELQAGRCAERHF